MPHKSVLCRKDGIINRDGAMYAAWVDGKIPHHRFATDGITRDVNRITSKMPLPLETTAILAAMSRKESGIMLLIKVYQFGYISGVHKQRVKDRAVQQSRRQQGTEYLSQGRCATPAKHPLKACVADLRTLADRLDSEYQAAEEYEHQRFHEGYTGTDGSGLGEDPSLAVAHERKNLLRSVLGELEPILYRMQEEEADSNA